MRAPKRLWIVMAAYQRGEIFVVHRTRLAAEQDERVTVNGHVRGYILAPKPKRRPKKKARRT